jgi:hypothetical protein
MSSNKKPRNYGFQIAFWAGLLMTLVTCVLILGLVFQILEPLQRLIHLQIKSVKTEISSPKVMDSPVEIVEELPTKDTIIVIEKIQQICTRNHCEPDSLPISNSSPDSN